MRAFFFAALIGIISSAVHSENLCDYEAVASKNNAFADLATSSTMLGQEMCWVISGRLDRQPALTVMITEWDKLARPKFAKLEQVASVDMKNGFDLLVTSFRQADPITLRLTSVGQPAFVIGSGQSKVTGSISTTNDASCQDNFGKSCLDAFHDIMTIVNIVNEAKNRADTASAARNISLYSATWDRYFDDARALTPWELVINTKIYRDQLKKDSFVLPPTLQWFILHPSVVIENVSDAIDGDQQKEALSIEWAGVNLWGGKIPIGASLVTTLTDRAGVDDVRHGVMVHLFNDFSIGYTGIASDENGFFITVDLMKMFQDKQERLENYKNQIYKLK